MKEKLELLNFTEDEIKKSEKFLVSLALSGNIAEVQEIITYLKENNIEIKHARELKVLTQSKEEIVNKVNILNQMHLVDIYREDPKRLTYNVISITKKAHYCLQKGIPLKTVNGTYENFLFREKAWASLTLNEEGIQKEEYTAPVEVENVVENNINIESVGAVIDDIAPVFEDKLLDEKIDEPVKDNAEVINLSEFFKQENNELKIEDNLADIVNFQEYKDAKEEKEELHMDIKEYQAKVEENENVALEKTTNFATIQDQLAELDEISFDDFDFGGMAR